MVVQYGISSTVLKFPCRQMLKRRALFPTVNSLERRFPLYVEELRRDSKLEMFNEKKEKALK